ncbi:MAG TPA: hypothetical protein VFI38_08625 [Candidatus Acidoferrum sp.]|nr:hypothetical protein [Candidatus Acidoferrum sp.]
MQRETIIASLMENMRLGVCVCAFAVLTVVSAPALVADPIYNFDLHGHSDTFSLTPPGPTHPEHDPLISKNSLLSEESSFSPDPSFLASFGHEDHWLHGDSLADKRNHGLHLGWGMGVEHNRHRHYGDGPTNGNIDLPTDPVAGPEPSTIVSLLSGLAIVLLFRSLPSRFWKGVNPYAAGSI